MGKRTTSEAQVEPERQVQIETLVWRGITIEVSYEPDWLRGSEFGSKYAQAHLALQVQKPERAPLPVTDTGYRSHFLEAGIVEAAGGPAAFARAWLDIEAKSPSWLRMRARWAQLDLFD